MLPKNGTQPIRCQCKHFADDHSEAIPYKCSKGCACKKFTSSYTCGCGQPTYAHKTIVETKEERISRGHPVGHDVPYAAMGGITGFSSLMDGYMRLDDSGYWTTTFTCVGAASPDDHPFLRAHAGMAGLSLEDGMGGGAGQVARQTTEEEDMAYFEKRYQARLKAEKEQARLQRSPQAKRLTEGSTGHQSTSSAARRTGPSKGTSATKPAASSRSPGTQTGRPSHKR
ncbi:hypothetical protein OS493_030528 [Desmophyllum pertusum]|uniref:Protein FAM221A n=1 Tax=Desmophyllum pertusum TaxID=174260 RepID=A0A9W9YK48_9CNID|nr:hypothetical protein OS493_030528 [Desmophyllum pertusum]